MALAYVSAHEYYAQLDLKSTQYYLYKRKWPLAVIVGR